MIKITYKPSMLFNYKLHTDSNLNARTYTYITPSAIKSAILGQVICLDGIDKAKELFERIKKLNVKTIINNNYSKTQFHIRRFGNSYYDTKEPKNVKTMGIREYAHIDRIEFLIDNIEGLEVYFKNINYLGASDSFVYLRDIQEVNSYENVLEEISGDIDEDKEIYTIYDWDDKAKFEDIYMYSKKKKGYDFKYKKILCNLTNLQ